jgi:hypothetical protein
MFSTPELLRAFSPSQKIPRASWKNFPRRGTAGIT